MSVMLCQAQRFGAPHCHSRTAAPAPLPALLPGTLVWGEFSIAKKEKPKKQ